jgi:hypothetical protein
MEMEGEMSKALVASQELALTDRYDPVDQEPEVDILIRTRRVNGHSQVAFVTVGEGAEKPSQTQRDWIASLVRYVAGLIIQRPVPREGDHLASVAIRCRAEAAAMTTGYVNAVTLLVKKRGVTETAKALGLKSKQVEHLLRLWGREPDDLTEAQLRKQLEALPGIITGEIPLDEKIAHLKEGEPDWEMAGLIKKREPVLAQPRSVGAMG